MFGVALSAVAGPRIAIIDWGSVAPGDPTSAVVEAVLGAGLVVWGIVRARRRDIRAPKPRSPQGTGLIPLVVSGILFAFLAILDPTFTALVVVVGQDKPFWLVAIAYTIWIFVSQAPLAVVIVAMAGGKPQRIVVWFQSWWTKIRLTVGRLVTAAVLFVGVFFLLDSVWWFAT